MSAIQEKPIVPQHPHHSMSDKFARIDNNPNIRNAQYYTPIIPTPKQNYRPQFGKSPLTSVQMYRKNKTRSINFNEHPEQPVTTQPSAQQKKSFLSDVDWKKYLLWGLLGFLAIALLVGLIFLIKALIGSGDEQNQLKMYRQKDDSQGKGYYQGVNPIYVSPVPYSTMEVPTVSGYVEQPSASDKYVYTTAPTAMPEVRAKKQQEAKPQQPPAANPITQPTIKFTSDSNQNFVNPIDVYGHHHE